MRQTRRTALLVAMALALVGATAACDDGGDATAAPTASVLAPTAEPEPTTDAPTDAPTTEPEPTTDAPTDAPTTEPEPTADAPTTEPARPTDQPDVDLGNAVRGTSVISGPDLMASLDPNDPAQAANIADIEALLEATGAGLDQLTMMNGVSLDGQAFVGAMRLDRADIELAGEAFVESMFDNVGEPRVEDAELGGKDVTLVFDDAVPEQPPLVVYTSAEIVWLISGPEASAISVLEELP